MRPSRPGWGRWATGEEVPTRREASEGRRAGGVTVRIGLQGREDGAPRRGGGALALGAGPPGGGGGACGARPPRPGGRPGFDPPGLVKGWAGGRAAAPLGALGRRDGIAHCLNAGGDVTAGVTAAAP